MDTRPASSNHDMIAVIFLRNDIHNVQTAVQLNAMSCINFFPNGIQETQKHLN